MQRLKEAELACRKALAAKPDSILAAVQLCGLLHSSQQHSAALEVMLQAQKQLKQASSLQALPQPHLVRAAPFGMCSPSCYVQHH